MMYELMERIASRSTNPQLFLIGMSLLYATGLILLLAALLKFVEHGAKPQAVARKVAHPFATREMTLCIVALFPFWLNSIGQIPMSGQLQLVYFGIGAGAVLFALCWHLIAKRNIRTMWSDAIEIKQNHQLISTGAYALARHPMYASLLLWCWGASLLLMNWITLTLTTLVMLPLMMARARAEERELARVLVAYPDYQTSTHMLTPTLGGVAAVVVKCVALVLFGYFVWSGLTLPSVLLLFVVHLYLGYSLVPEKVAFSYRSKSGMLVVLWALSLLWHPLYYLLYVVLAMFLYGMKFNCPCMIVYNKYQRCPCFDVAAKCFVKKPAAPR